MRRSRLFVIPVIVGAALLVTSCSALLPGGTDDTTEEPAPTEVTIAYVEWAHAQAITHVAATILEDNGFDVTLDLKTDSDGISANQQMWQAVAEGSADAHFAAWLPETHADMYGPDGEFTDQVVQLGANYEGAEMGLVVPSYVNINSATELDGLKADFNGKIHSVADGTNIYKRTDTAIDENTYGLNDWTLVRHDTDQGETPMTDALETAINANENIVVTGWHPHWMFGKWDLKVLDDPQGVYAEAQTIYTMVRTGLDADYPDAYNFLDQFDFTQLEVEQVMSDINDGVDASVAARNFVDNNQDQIDALLP